MMLKIITISSFLCLVAFSIFLLFSYGFFLDTSWTAFLGNQNTTAIVSNLLVKFGATKGNWTPHDHVLTTQISETPMPPLLRASFKRSPVWDFDDVYNQDFEPRQTTCAQSLRNSQDASFKTAFLPNINLYMHKDSVNISEWNRLSHFNNPFGFMQFPYNVVMEAVRLIPKPVEPLFLPKPGSGGCVRCAVVGTGGILNGSGMGKEIDDHDYVIRMNGAVINGHEEDVGNRTSAYLHTAHSITGSKVSFRKYGYKSAPADKVHRHPLKGRFFGMSAIPCSSMSSSCFWQGIKYVMMPEGMRDYYWLIGLLKRQKVPGGPYRNKEPWTYYGDQFDEKRFYVLHPDFLRYIRNRFLKSPRLNGKHWAIVRPTNGAFALFTALHTCDIVSAYGFMTDDYMNYNNYYFQNKVKTRVVFYINHDYKLEMQTWKKFHEAQILRLYQRAKTEKVTTKPQERSEAVKN